MRPVVDRDKPARRARSRTPIGFARRHDELQQPEARAPDRGVCVTAGA